MRYVRTLLLSALAGFQLGCGTMMSLMGNAEMPANKRMWVYSGVRLDAMALGIREGGGMPWVLRGIVVLDLPVSLCADTVCLPYTAIRALSDPREILVYLNDRSRTDIYSEVKSEARETITVGEACQVLRSVSARPKSVEIHFYLRSKRVAIEDVGKLYETINANTGLVFVCSEYAKDVLNRYLATARGQHQPDEPQ